MNNNIKFRIESDNSGALRAVRELKQGIKDLANDAKNLLGNKVTQYFGVAAIEETIRRTGEWAEELTKSAQQLNINTEEMQALQLAARRAHVDIGTVTGYYDRMASAAKEALNGNVLLRNSLKNLGIEGKNLATMTGAQMFGQLIKTTGKNPAKYVGDLQRIFGEENLPNVGAVLTTMRGKTPQAYAQENIGGGIASKESIAAVAATWGKIVEDLQAIGLKFLPVGQLLMVVVEGILKSLRGAATYVFNIGKLIGYGTKSAFLGMFGEKGSGVEAWEDTKKHAGKVGRQTGVAITSGISLGFWKPKYLTKGLTESEIYDAEGMGDAALMLATGGLGALKGAQYGTKAAAALRTKSLQEAILKSASKGPVNKLEIAKELFKDNNLLKTLRNAKQLPTAYGAGAGIGLGGLAAGVVGGVQTTSDVAAAEAAKQNMPINRMLGLNPSGFLSGGIGGGGGNLKIGGIFGTDVSMQIISLNSQMLDKLEQIVVNTTPNPAYSAVTSTFVGTP